MTTVFQANEIPTLDEVAQAMNSFGETVRWDRCVARDDGGVVFGWIARADGRSDFLCLYWGEGGFGMTTSSAEHSERFSQILFGTSEGHRPCQRIEDVFPQGTIQFPARAMPRPRNPATECPGHGRGGTGLACCDRAGEYNGFGSDGPTIFRCPNGCSCHD